MFGFIMRRLVLLITTFGLLTVILFWVHIRLNSIDITRFIPEYLSYSSHLLRLDFGTNSETGASILEEIKLYLPHTGVNFRFYLRNLRRNVAPLVRGSPTSYFLPLN